MAQEGSEGSVANSSTTPNFWDLHTSSWNNVLPWNPINPNSNSSCDEEISISNSFTNTSNHSGLSDDSSHHDHLIAHVPSSTSNDLTGGEPSSENHLWSQVLLSVGSTGDLHNSQDVGENFLEALSSKNLSSTATDMFEPACDYLKKMDNGCSWEFPNPASFNNLEKQFNSFNGAGSLLEHERLTNLSNLVSNWSIALPLQDANHQLINTNSIDNHFSSESSDLSNHHQMIKHQNISNSLGIRNSNSDGCFPCYGSQHDDNQHQEIENSEASFLRSFKNHSNNNFRYQMGNSVTGEQNNKYYYGLLDAPWSNNTKNLSDISSFNGCLLNKPMVDMIQNSNKHCSKASNSSEMNNKKHGHDSTSLPSQTRGSGRGSGKKRCDDNSETVFKKPKHESSSSKVSTTVKVQAPKVKLGDRITALQQIVSPFGKTDTASVLQEAIGYIKFLHEQVQLLSNPYVKANTNKDPWGLVLLESSSSNGGGGGGGGGRKDKSGGEGKVFDLKNRGLCLVPISCTPQVYRENSNGGSDYWTPTYRGSLYR